MGTRRPECHDAVQSYCKMSSWRWSPFSYSVDKKNKGNQQKVGIDAYEMTYVIIVFFLHFGRTLVIIVQTHARRDARICAYHIVRVHVLLSIAVAAAVIVAVDASTAATAGRQSCVGRRIRCHWMRKTKVFFRIIFFNFIQLFRRHAFSLVSSNSSRFVNHNDKSNYRFPYFYCYCSLRLAYYCCGHVNLMSNQVYRPTAIRILDTTSSNSNLLGDDESIKKWFSFSVFFFLLLSSGN